MFTKDHKTAMNIWMCRIIFYKRVNTEIFPDICTILCRHMLTKIFYINVEHPFGTQLIYWTGILLHNRRFTAGY